MGNCQSADPSTVDMSRHLCVEIPKETKPEEISCDASTVRLSVGSSHSRNSSTEEGDAKKKKQKKSKSKSSDKPKSKSKSKDKSSPIKKASNDDEPSRRPSMKDESLRSSRHSISSSRHSRDERGLQTMRAESFAKRVNSSRRGSRVLQLNESVCEMLSDESNHL